MIGLLADRTLLAPHCRHARPLPAGLGVTLRHLHNKKRQSIWTISQLRHQRLKGQHAAQPYDVGCCGTITPLKGWIETPLHHEKSSRADSPPVPQTCSRSNNTGLSSTVASE